MDYDEETSKKCCYKCAVQSIEDLSIYHNPANSTTVLWNKYQVFFYDNFDFTATTKIFVSEYQICDILLTNNFLLCIDSIGNVHVTVLKFKSSTQQKQMKMVFQPRENNIKTFLQYKEDQILSLKYEYDTYFLCLHKLNADFKIAKKAVLVSNGNLPVTVKKSCIMIKTPLKEEIFNELTRKTLEKYQFFNGIESDCDLVIMSLDNSAVYCCIFSPRIPADEIELIQLYLSPAEVKNIEITSSHYVLISLSIGTIIRLNLMNFSTLPEIIHLNMAIEKLVAINNVFVYTDGVSLWKAEMSTDKLKLKDLSIKHVKNIAVYDEKIICTTYTKLIYVIPFTSGSFVDESVNSVKVLVNNSDYLENIFNEIEKNNELVKIMNKEQNYILATALSNRQDVINNIKYIDCNIIVYDNFNTIQEKNLTLTEDLSQYFKPDIYIFLIRLTFDKTCQQIHNILSNIAEVSTFNITIISNNNILKVICTELESNLNNINYIIPLEIDNISSDFHIKIKIVSNIPRAFDERNNEIILYKHSINLKSEHFIRTPTDDYKFLKNHIDEIENLNVIVDNYSVQCNNDLKQTKDWSLYMKLPTNYKERFKNIDFHNENLNETKIFFINHQLNNNEFLNTRNTINFSVGKDIVALEILNDGFSEPILKIMSKNLEKALEIRQFVSRLIYKDYGDLEKEKQFINWSFYARTENLQKSIKNAVLSSSQPEEIYKLIEMFEQNIVGSLPL